MCATVLGQVARESSPAILLEYRAVSCMGAKFLLTE